MEQFLLISSILLWVVMLLNLLLTLALIRRVNALPAHSAKIEIGPPVGEKAPDFSAGTLDGKTFTLTDYIGRTTAFVFVAPDCHPCHDLIPSLKTLVPLAQQGGAELVLVCDGALLETQEMVKELDIHIPLLVAPRLENTFFDSYKVEMTPSYCLFDEQGIVRAAGLTGEHDERWRVLTEGWRKQAALTR